MAGIDNNYFLGISNDPLTNFRITDPENGAVRSLPLDVRFAIDVTTVMEFDAYYADALLCLELNKQWKTCKVLGDPSIIFQSLPEGNYTASAYITDKNDQFRCHDTEEVAFTILSPDEYDQRNARLAERSREEQHFPVDVDLLHWAEDVEIRDQGDGDTVLPRSRVSSTSSPMLLIGVKTAVVTSFPRRQAIRDTWANPANLPHDVKVLFLGCEPNITSIQNEGDRRRIMEAVAKERAVYKDLLTEELACTDSYRGLSDKVLSFMHLSAAEFPEAKFVMLTDDDIYVKVDQLAEGIRDGNRSDGYFGEVWSLKFANKQKPIRDPESKYYLPEDQYPMRNLLPYASGPHYVVSMTGVRFIAKNYWRLMSMNGLEDVSSGFWLKTTQVNAQHVSDFSSVRGSMKCLDTLTSFADLSPLGIRSIHSNLVSNRSFCHGFHSVTWYRHFDMIPSLKEMLQRPTQQTAHLNSLNFDLNSDENAVAPWDIQIHVTNLTISQYLEVTSIVSTSSKASIKVKYFPSVETLFSYTQRVWVQVQTLVTGDKLNSDSFGLELRTKLQQKLRSIEEAGRFNRATLELWRYNLFVADPETSPHIITHSRNAVYGSTVLECLFVSIYEHHKRPILVMSEPFASEHYQNKPDVVVFSVLDADCEPVTKAACQHLIMSYIDAYANQSDHSTTIMMIAGEPYDTEGLDERIILLSTVSGLSQKKYAYIPLASASFGERLGHSPTTLLKPAFEPMVTKERRFCAYLYARCDRPQREYMFDILNAMEPVDALGI
ncbi:Hypothetical protein PHPALM_11808, partial [Phytophthora palmivora]